MNAPQVRGITGLLDGILSPTRQAAADSHGANQPKKHAHAGHLASTSVSSSPITVRRGRPPGKAVAAARKEKVTIWITSLDSHSLG